MSTLIKQLISEVKALNSSSGSDEHYKKMCAILIEIKNNFIQGEFTRQDFEMLSKEHLLGQVFGKYAIFVDYYFNVGPLSNIKTRDRYKYNGSLILIGSRINEVRKKKKTGTLIDDDVKLFDAMGLTWDIRNYTRSEVLKAYCKQNNTTLGSVSRGTLFKYKNKSFDIGIMLSNLRQDMVRGDLTEAEIKEYNNLGMVWHLMKRFEDRVAPLIAYAKEFGSIANIKSGEMYTYNGKEVAVGNLIGNLRQAYWSENKYLSGNNIELLNSLGMNWGKSKKKIDELTK